MLVQGGGVLYLSSSRCLNLSVPAAAAAFVFSLSGAVRLPACLHECTLLQALTREDFYRILTEPHANLIYQNKELLRTEDVTLDVQDEAVQEIAEVAFQANATVQNIGARRLITIVERVLEDIAFQVLRVAVCGALDEDCSGC